MCQKNAVVKSGCDAGVIEMLSGVGVFGFSRNLFPVALAPTQSRAAFRSGLGTTCYCMNEISLLGTIPRTWAIAYFSY
jgi:hypothetical protein